MKVGFIGLGDIGAQMAWRLLEQGLQLSVWNRTQEKAAALIAAGAHRAVSPAALMDECAVICLCLSSHEAAEEVCQGPGGLWSSAGGQDRCRVVVDLSTGSPEAARHLAAQAASRGAAWIDAPVSGGTAAAREGRLTIFAGGDTRAIEQVGRVFKALSARFTHTGPSGSGQAYKLCNQLIVACNVAAIAEAVALARRAGLDAGRLAEVLRGGFADSAPLQVFGPRMAGRNHEPRLGSIGLMLKDVRLVIELAESATAHTPMLRSVEALYSKACTGLANGPGADLGQIIESLEELS